MKSKIALTKKDFVVVLICFVFLIANIAAVGESGRKRAKRIVCLSNLHKWGQIFQTYTADNDGFFHSRQIGTMLGYSRMWQYVYKPDYNDKMMRFCPTAVDPTVNTGTFGTWNYAAGSFRPTSDPSLLMPGEREYDASVGHVVEGFYTGSYGMNRYIENLQGGSFSTDPAFWRHVEVNGASQVPILMDSMYMYYWVTGTSADDPPAYDGDYTPPQWHYICINRHDGFINVVFMDWSARKVGLKELWTLKHSRTFNTCNQWTICGFGGNKQACKSAWDAVAPWMRNFPVY